MRLSRSSRRGAPVRSAFRLSCHVVHSYRDMVTLDELLNIFCLHMCKRKALSTSAGAACAVLSRRKCYVLMASSFTEAPLASTHAIVYEILTRELCRAAPVRSQAAHTDFAGLSSSKSAEPVSGA